MDRLVAEIETEKETAIETKQEEPQKQSYGIKIKSKSAEQVQSETKSADDGAQSFVSSNLNSSFQNEYSLNSNFSETANIEKKAPLDKLEGERIESYVQNFENMTLADVKKERQQKADEEFKIEKENLIQDQFSVEQQDSQTIIEKPNYDLIEENPKVLKLKKHDKKANKPKKKLASIILACALGASALVCVANCVAIDNAKSAYINIDETYNLNLKAYLKNISKLDASKKSMQFLDTYPEDVLPAGDTGKKSNWFDNICNYIGGFFGG